MVDTESGAMREGRMNLVIQYSVPVENQEEADSIVTELRDGQYDIETVVGDEANFTAFVEIA